MPVCVSRRQLVLSTIHFHQVRPIIGHGPILCLGQVLASCQILWGLETFVWVLRSLGWGLPILLLHFQWLKNGCDSDIEVEVEVAVLGIYTDTLGNKCGTVDNSAH